MTSISVGRTIFIEFFTRYSSFVSAKQFVDIKFCFVLSVGVNKKNVSTEKKCHFLSRSHITTIRFVHGGQTFVRHVSSRTRRSIISYIM